LLPRSHARPPHLLNLSSPIPPWLQASYDLRASLSETKYTLQKLQAKAAADALEAEKKYDVAVVKSSQV
jgi:hypothetical protein